MGWILLVGILLVLLLGWILTSVRGQALLILTSAIVIGVLLALAILGSWTIAFDVPSWEGKLFWITIGVLCLYGVIEMWRFWK